MKIDWDFSRPAAPRHGVWRKLKSALGTTPPPLHMSEHYDRSHFHDDGAPRLF